MIPRVIHCIYFDFGRGGWENIPEFAWQHGKTQIFTKNNNIELILWNEKMVEDLIEKEYPHFWNLYEGFPHKIMKVDFAKYAILHNKGGIYIDMDIHPIRNMDDLFLNNQFFVRWDDSHLPYNAVLGTVAGTELYAEILQHCEDSFNEKSQMEIYQKWKGRYVFQTTGHYMLHRVLKKNKIIKDDLLNIMFINNAKKAIYTFPTEGEAIFSDLNTSAWYGGI